MASNTTTLGGMNVLPTALGIVGALLVLAVLAGVKLPLVTSERAAFWVLALIGVVMCTMGGIGHTVNASVGWMHPINLVGYVLGAATVLILASVLLGFKLPVVSGDRSALVTLAVLMAGKWATSMVYYLFLSRPS